MHSTHVPTEPRLRIRALSVRYGLGPPAVDAVDLDAHAGEVVAIVGESGAGKSSIGAALLDLVDPPGSWRADAIDLDGERLDYAQRHVRGRDVSVIFQDPQTALNPLFTVESQLVHMVRHHQNLSMSNARERAVRMLDEVGIPDAARRVKQYPHQFSGGMRQRVVIALAIACRPRLIVADEPTSALDVSVRGQVLDLIRRLARERGTPVLLVTHDIAAVARIADSVVVMRAGRLVEVAETQALLSAPSHAYSRMLIAAVPPSNRRLHRFDVPPPDELAAPAVHITNLDAWLRDRADTAQASDVLQVVGVSKRFALRPGLFGRGTTTHTAVDDVSIRVGRGEAFGLVGESGSGKSTLAHLVAGLLKPDAGHVEFTGRRFDRHASPSALAAYRRGLQMVFQDPFSSLNRRWRIADVVAEPIVAQGQTARRETARLVGALLERVGLPADAMHRHPHAFSGGQRQRIALARALAGRPQLLICDEPTSALDVSIQAQILNLLMDLKDDLGLALLFITHDLPVVRQVADRVGVLQASRLVEVETTEALFDTPRHPYTRMLMNELPHSQNAGEHRNG